MLQNRIKIFLTIFFSSKDIIFKEFVTYHVGALTPLRVPKQNVERGFLVKTVIRRKQDIPSFSILTQDDLERKHRADKP